MTEDTTGHHVQSTACRRWKDVLGACFARRLRPNDAQDALQKCAETFPVSGNELATILLQAGTVSERAIDPLLPAYTTSLLGNGLIEPSHMLHALLSISPYRSTVSGSPSFTVSAVASASLQETIFALLSSPYAGGQAPPSSKESTNTFRALLSYVQAYNAYETVQQIENPGDQGLDASLVSAYEHLGAFLVILLSNLRVRKHLIKTIPKSVKGSVASAVGHFATTLSQWSQSPIYQKLQMFLKMPPLVDQNPDGSLQFSPADIAMEVVDLPRINSRCALYAYFNAALCHRPLMDDVHLLSFLQTRYGDNFQSMMVDTIVGAFDALVNVLHRHEAPHALLCHRSFLVNKVPVLIGKISSSQLYQPGMLYQCIQSALGRINTHPFPPLSSDSAGINEAIKEARHQFVQACFHRELLTENAAATLLNAPVVKSIRHSKQTLFQQLLSQSQKSDDLVKDLESMEGNVGNVAGALADAVRHLAISKETMSLKAICLALCKSLPSVDILLQHARLQDLLLPLCTYLNEWTHDDDQSESQPAYEDFATVLLFTFALIHRYDVHISELASLGRDSFVIRYLEKIAESSRVDSLTKDEVQILGKWVKGLFAVDEKGETSGIGDETMSGCSPQMFHLIVPTLFEQIVLACRAKALGTSTLKGGLEFFLEPFLLPSLIGGCKWLANHMLTNVKDVDIVLQILQKLLRPSSLSADAQIMHKIILATLYQTLRPALTELEKRQPSRKDIPQMIASLKQHADSQYSRDPADSEIREWVAAAGNMRGTVVELVSQLTTWSANSDMITIPTSYTHRTIDAAVLKLGADQVLQLINEEVCTQTLMGLGQGALDVATAIICAPNIINTSRSPHSAGQRTFDCRLALALRDALKLRLDDSKYLLSQEQIKTESLVRLGRLVEAQSTIMDMPLLNGLQMDLDTGTLMTGMDETNTNAAAAAASASNLDTSDQAVLDAAAADFSAAMTANVDLTGDGGDLNMGDAGDLNLDLGADLFGGDGINFDMVDASAPGTGQPQGQQTQQNADEDIFAGIDLGMLGDDDFGF